MPAATAIKLVQRWEQNWGITAEILGLTAPSMADDERARRVVPPLPGAPTRCCRRSRSS